MEFPEEVKIILNSDLTQETRIVCKELAVDYCCLAFEYADIENPNAVEVELANYYTNIFHALNNKMN